MLLSLVLEDDGDDDSLAALYEVGPYTIQVKQRPDSGHLEHQEERVVEEVRAGSREPSCPPGCHQAALSRAGGGGGGARRGALALQPRPAGRCRPRRVQALRCAACR
jgi:hypothetical protein